MALSNLIAVALLCASAGAISVPTPPGGTAAPPLLSQSERRAPLARRPPPGQLVAARKKEPPPGDDLAVAGKVAGIALCSEAFPYVCTALIVLACARWTDVRSLADVLDVLIGGFGKLGGWSYPVYAAMVTVLQTIPLISGMLLILSLIHI